MKEMRTLHRRREEKSKEIETLDKEMMEIDERILALIRMSFKNRSADSIPNR